MSRSLFRRTLFIVVCLAMMVMSLGIAPKALASAAAICGPFWDVDSTSIWCTYIIRIYNLGITTGYGDGSYRPNNNVIRGEMAAFLSRITTANTNDNEPYIYSVDNKDNGGTFSGDGIVSMSYDQNGVEGITYGATWADYGVYGQSNGTGTSDYPVYGYATSGSASPAVAGYNAGVAATSYGVYGAAGTSHGVYGYSYGAGYSYYGGWFYGPQGVRAESSLSGSDAITAECNAGGACWGLDTYSLTSYGIYASTGEAANNYGLYTPDNIQALNYFATAGFAMIALNGSGEALQPGDVVAVIGMGAPLPESNVPVMLVRKADSTNAAGIVGVITSAYKIEVVARHDTKYVATTFPDQEGKGNPSATYAMPVEGERQVVIQSAVDGPVAPDGYMGIQIQGIAQVNVEAGAGIQAGDLLTISSSGTAVRAEAVTVTADGVSTYQAGTILGKALEPLLEGMTKIWVMVDLR